ncbi:Peptidoglycan-binding Lysin subgroup [Penicillium sp. IBT 16267x]|nr:Peptidoglycan-binding Lysin subgroup [Penicillium sp. IBT 16267x]
MKTMFILWGLLGLFKTATALSPNVRATSNVPEESGGFCYTYVVQSFSDTCQSIASAYGITEAEIENYNSDTWGWTGCAGIYQGDIICLSSGEPPMPVALPQATCGPQVPGTVRPKNYSDLSSLNPCSTGCCIMGGSCATVADADLDMCRSSICISNCETETTSESTTAVKTTAATEHTSSTKTTSSTSSTKSSTTEKLTSTTEHTSSTSTKTTAAAATGTGLWTLAAYTGETCNGDYYVLTGTSLTDTECLSLHGGLNFEMTDGVSCGYYTDGGSTYADCDSSPELEIWSWSMSGGSCVAFEESCSNSGSNIVDIYDQSTGCQEQTMYHPHYYMTWRSLKCQVS